MMVPSRYIGGATKDEEAGKEKRHSQTDADLSLVDHLGLFELFHGENLGRVLLTDKAYFTKGSAPDDVQEFKVGNRETLAPEPMGGCFELGKLLSNFLLLFGSQVFVSQPLFEQGSTKTRRS